MRTRARAALLSFSLSFAALVTAGPLTGVAIAQQPAPDPVTEVARQRYEEGVKAFDAGRYEDARSAFLQAYALKRHPAVLLNLGLSEIRSGKYVEDGGNHLQQFLREHATATPDQKASAEKNIAEAKKKTAFVAVSVDVAGADVSVDGASIGKSPLLDPFFVKPGKHTLLATLSGKSATVQIDAKVGAATPASLTLGGAAPPSVAPVPGPPGAAPPATPAPAPAGPTAQPPYGPANAGGQMSFGGGLQPDTGPSSGREPFFDWYTRKPIAWVGTGVAGVGLVLGAVFTFAAISASGAADDHAAEIRAEADKDGIDEPCGPIDSDGDRDLPKYKTACNKLREDFSDYDTDVALAVTGWVFFGIGAIGTATYALVDWYPKKKATTGHVELAPVIAPGYQGLGVVGSF